MGLHWDVFVAVKVANLVKAREYRNFPNYEIISIKGSWYMRDKHLILDTQYPGSTLAKRGIIEFQTSNGPVQAEFDGDRLANFENLASENGWELKYWESFRSGNGTPRYRLVTKENA